jgi:hypothetical protein
LKLGFTIILKEFGKKRRLKFCLKADKVPSMLKCFYEKAFPPHLGTIPLAEDVNVG